LPVSRYTVISDIRANFHGRKIAETAGIINYKRTFVSYAPLFYAVSLLYIELCGRSGLCTRLEAKQPPAGKV
jgi:hypothetical protein